MYDGYRNRIIWIITLHVSHTQWYNHLLLLLLLCHLIQCQRGSGWLQVMRSFTFSPHLLLHRTLRINTSPRSYRRRQSLLLLLQRPCLIHRSGWCRWSHVAGDTSFHLFLLHILHVIKSILSHRHWNHSSLLLHLLFFLLFLLHRWLLLRHWRSPLPSDNEEFSLPSFPPSSPSQQTTLLVLDWFPPSSLETSFLWIGSHFFLPSPSPASLGTTYRHLHSFLQPPPPSPPFPPSSPMASASSATPPSPS